MPVRISEKTLARIRDYAVNEPSYTIDFAAWEMKVSRTTVMAANAILLEKGIVHVIEPQNGGYATVYAYNPPPNTAPTSRVVHDRPNSLPRAVAGAEPVPYTGQPKGPGDKPRRQSAHRIRRPKTRGVRP